MLNHIDPCIFNFKTDQEKLLILLNDTQLIRIVSNFICNSLDKRASPVQNIY